jgi:hypothetical protein
MTNIYVELKKNDMPINGKKRNMTKEPKEVKTRNNINEIHFEIV